MSTIADDLDVQVTYLGRREHGPHDSRPWPNHAYLVTLRYANHAVDVPYATGLGWKREPEEWLSEIRWAPGYIRGAKLSYYGRFPKQVRDRFYADRDARLRRAVLGSLAADILLCRDHTDDELNEELELKPSQIAAIRSQDQKVRDLLRHHVQEFIDAFSEEEE